MSLILLGILNSQVTAAGGGAAYDLLETTILTSNTTSLSFIDLDTYSDYKHLQLRATIKGSSTTLYSLDVNVSTASGYISSGYAWHELYGNGSSVLSTANGVDTEIELNYAISKSSVTGAYAGLVMDILDFSSSNKNKTVRSFYGNPVDAFVALSSGLVPTTDPITRLHIDRAGGFLVAGSRFSLYGVK